MNPSDCSLSNCGEELRVLQVVGCAKFDVDPKLLLLIPHVAAFPNVVKFVVVDDHDGNCVVHDWRREVFEFDHFVDSLTAFAEIFGDFTHDLLEFLSHFLEIGLIECWNFDLVVFDFIFICWD